MGKAASLSLSRRMGGWLSMWDGAPAPMPCRPLSRWSLAWFPSPSWERPPRSPSPSDRQPWFGGTTRKAKGHVGHARMWLALTVGLQCLLHWGQNVCSVQCPGAWQLRALMGRLGAFLYLLLPPTSSGGSFWMRVPLGHQGLLSEHGLCPLPITESLFHGASIMV